MINMKQEWVHVSNIMIVKRNFNFIYIWEIKIIFGVNADNLSLIACFTSNVYSIYICECIVNEMYVGHVVNQLNKIA